MPSGGREEFLNAVQEQAERMAQLARHPSSQFGSRGALRYFVPHKPKP
jgi:hypothetical protein